MGGCCDPPSVQVLGSMQVLGKLQDAEPSVDLSLDCMPCLELATGMEKQTINS